MTPWAQENEMVDSRTMAGIALGCASFLAAYMLWMRSHRRSTKVRLLMAGGAVVAGMSVWCVALAHVWFVRSWYALARSFYVIGRGGVITGAVMALAGFVLMVLSPLRRGSL